MLEKGLIQVYHTGSSDRVNLAPFGLSLRAAGQGLRVLVVTGFVPFELMQGASAATALLKPNLVIDCPDAEEGESPGIQHDERLLASFQRALLAVKAADFDIVILDGILSMIREGLVPLEEILALMQEKPPTVELVLTGLYAPGEIIDRADLVTEMVLRSPEKGPGKGSLRGEGAQVEVVTGDGKGKTTYCLGKAMLTSCLETSCAILQFIKSPKPYGEVKAIGRLPNLSINTMGEGFVGMDGGPVQERHLHAAARAWEVAVREISSNKYGLLALDEINIATYYGLIRAEQVREVLESKPEGLHLLLSGRNAHPEVVEAATTVIEMKEIKHPFSKGVKARKGIEF